MSERPSLLGIPDHRDPERDETANFSFADDWELAALIAHAFPRIGTHKALRRLYEHLRDSSAPGARPGPAEVDRLIDSGRFPPDPLDDSYRTHGFAVMEKLHHYLADAGRPMPPRGTALDMGSGFGEFIEGLASEFDRLIVADFSMSFLVMAKKLAEELGLANVEFVCANAERLPFADGSVDFIHANNLIEHVTDKAAMLADAERVLTPGGLLFILSPNHFSLYVEPHFRLPAYGFIPRPIRRFWVARRYGWDTDSVTLLSLRRLRSLTSRAFGPGVWISFIPRQLDHAVMGGWIRTAVLKALNSRAIGGLADFVLNRALLAVMPYHVALCFKGRRG